MTALLRWLRRLLQPWAEAMPYLPAAPAGQVLPVRYQKLRLASIIGDGKPIPALLLAFRDPDGRALVLTLPLAHDCAWRLEEDLSDVLVDYQGRRN